MNNSTLKKINDLIENVYTIEIISDTEVCVDDYNDGELENVNSWTNDTTIFHTEQENLSSELLTYLTTYIEDTLYVELNKDNTIREALEAYDDSDYFYVSKMVNKDNCEPYKSEIEEWKKGQTKLYVQNISITVKINGKSIPADLLSDILFTSI